MESFLCDRLFLTIMTAKFFFGNLCRFIFYYYLCTRLIRNDAQMAESVDALVSNTSGFTSIPVRPRVWVLKKAVNRLIDSLYCFIGYKQGINKRHNPSLFPHHEGSIYRRSFPSIKCLT